MKKSNLHLISERYLHFNACYSIHKFSIKIQKSNDESARRVSVEAVPPKKKKPVVNPNPLGSFSKATGTVDQRDRSLTVMIPRAKYHPPLPKDAEVDGYKMSKSSSQMSVNQTKLINYLDASPAPAKNKTVSLIFKLFGILVNFMNFLECAM